MVRAMTDEDARRAQIAENLQCADMHPIEAAESFQALIAVGERGAPGNPLPGKELAGK